MPQFVLNKNYSEMICNLYKVGNAYYKGKLRELLEEYLNITIEKGFSYGMKRIE